MLTKFLFLSFFTLVGIISLMAGVQDHREVQNCKIVYEKLKYATQKYSETGSENDYKNQLKAIQKFEQCKELN